MKSRVDAYNKKYKFDILKDLYEFNKKSKVNDFRVFTDMYSKIGDYIFLNNYLKAF